MISNFRSSRNYGGSQKTSGYSQTGKRPPEDNMNSEESGYFELGKSCYKAFPGERTLFFGDNQKPYTYPGVFIIKYTNGKEAKRDFISDDLVEFYANFFSDYFGYLSGTNQDNHQDNQRNNQQNSSNRNSERRENHSNMRPPLPPDRNQGQTQKDYSPQDGFSEGDPF